jgi:hypothetical protein
MFRAGLRLADYWLNQYRDSDGPFNFASHRTPRVDHRCAVWCGRRRLADRTGCGCHRGDGACCVPCAAPLGSAGRRGDARAGGRASLERRAGVARRAWTAARRRRVAGPGPPLAGRLAARRAAPLERGTTAGRQLDDASRFIGYPAHSPVDRSRAHRHRRRPRKPRNSACDSSSARVSLYDGAASGRAPCERVAPRRRLARSPSRHHLSLCRRALACGW